MKISMISLTLFCSFLFFSCEEKAKPPAITNGLTSSNGKAHADEHASKIQNGILPSFMTSTSDKKATFNCLNCHTGPLVVDELTIEGKKIQSEWIKIDNKRDTD